MSLLSSQLVSVQPMSAPTGQIFHMNTFPGTFSIKTKGVIARTKKNKHIPNEHGEAPVCIRCATKLQFIDDWGQSTCQSRLPCYFCDSKISTSFWVKLPDIILMVQDQSDITNI